MKIAKDAAVTLAAPIALSCADLAVIDGGMTQDEVIDKIGQEKWNYFDTHRPAPGQSRDSYAHRTIDDSDYERWDSDRYWDWRKSQGDKLGSVK